MRTVPIQIDTEDRINTIAMHRARSELLERDRNRAELREMVIEFGVLVLQVSGVLAFVGFGCLLLARWMGP